MKGLIIKDIELMKGNRRLYAGVYLIAVFMLFVTGMNTIFFVSYISILSGIIGLNTVSFDQADNGMAFLMTLPVSRKSYAAEKYVFGLCFCVVSWILAVLVGIAVHCITGAVVDYQEWFWGCLSGLWIAVLSVSICIPVEFKFRPENVRFIFMGIFIALAGIAYGGIRLIQMVTKVDMDLMVSNYLSGHTVAAVMICLAICLVIFLGSFMISTRIMEKKEF